MQPQDSRLRDAYIAARQHHRAGRLEQAEELYRWILQQLPDHPPTLHLLGVLRERQGHPQEAVELIGRAIAAKPHEAAYHNNLGNALKALERSGEAEAAYREALRLRPDYPGALSNLAGLLSANGDWQAAIPLYQRALELQPALAEARIGLGQVLAAHGDVSGAEDCLRQATELAPADSQAQFTLASLYRQQGSLTKAAVAFEAAIRLRPDWAEAHCNLGAVLHSQGEVERAARSYQRALALDPTLAEAHFNYGNSLQVLGFLTEARDAYRRALEAGPKFQVQVYCYLIDVCMQLADWREYPQQLEELVWRLEEHLRADDPVTLPMLSLNALPLPNALRLAVARQQARQISAAVEPAARALPPFEHRPAPVERLRIGYVSPDFREHAVGSLIHDLFAHHDRSAFEVHGYSLHEGVDAVNRQVRRACDRYTVLADAGLTDAARTIYADGIHILVDLAGHTTFSRPGIFALRPAPVQLQYLGYLDTMGADFLPYTIADHEAISPEIARDFSESIVYLPDCFAPASTFEVTYRTPRRGECGLPENGFVYCCFNRLHKIEPEVFSAWMEILQRVPDSVLWLYAGESAEGRSNLRREAESRGVDPARLVFAVRMPQPEYLARYRLADLLLDTFVYNGGATTIGALYVGLPVLTRRGPTFLSRMGSSLCRAAGLASLVCDTTAGYVERAVELARNPAERRELRGRLEADRNTLTLFDMPRFVRGLERAYRLLWADAMAGVGPRSIEVPGDAA